MISPFQNPIVSAFMLGIAASLSLSAFAAGTGVDAGSILRQKEQELNAPKLAPPKKKEKTSPNSATQPTDAAVLIKRFEFVGNSKLSNEVLTAALNSYLNRTLTLNQIKAAADVITNTYREAGWTVRAFIPKQEIIDGVVAIEIVETVFGEASFQGNSLKRIEASRLVKMAEAILPKGQSMHANDIDRALLLLDDLPGVSVAGSLVEGKGDRETNLLISAVDEALITGSAGVDNQGSRATGIERLTANFNVNSPSGVGDLFVTNFMKTRGAEFARGVYSLPVGNNGWRAGVHASYLKYEVLQSFDVNAVGIFGTANSSGIDVSYPLIRSQLNNLSFNWSYDYKVLENYVADTLSSNYKISVNNFSLNGNRIDYWSGGGSTNASIMFTLGRLNNDESPNAQNDADGARVAGNYSKLNFYLNRLQTINADLSLFTAFSFQAANKNLDSSERMYLGGASGIRAFPSSEAGGASGQTIIIELRRRLDRAFTLAGFYDYGHVTVNKNNVNASDGTPINTINSYALQGYGTSLVWQNGKGAELKGTIARRIASNPAADSSTGMDGDKTKIITRLWVSANISF